MNYKDKFYKSYISSHVGSLYGDVSLEKTKKELFVWRAYFGKFLPENKDIKILDLGCGKGEFVYWLKEMGFKYVEGVDVSEEQVRKAGELGIENVYLADLRDFLKDKKGRYDAIFARDLLEHFTKEELLEIIELIHASLSDNGVFVTQTVNAENLFWGRLRHGDFTHELAFTADSIRQLLKVGGFADVEVRPQRPVVHGLKSLIRYVLWRLIELWPKFYLLVETGSSRGIFTQNIIIKAKK